MWLCPRAALLPAAAVLPVLHSELLPFPIAFFHLESLSHRFVASGRSPPSQHPVHLQLGLSDLQRSLLQSDARTKPRFAGNALFAATTGAECFAGGFPPSVPLCALRHTERDQARARAPSQEPSAAERANVTHIGRCGGLAVCGELCVPPAALSLRPPPARGAGVGLACRGMPGVPASIPGCLQPSLQPGHGHAPAAGLAAVAEPFLFRLRLLRLWALPPRSRLQPLRAEAETQHRDCCGRGTALRGPGREPGG